MSRPTEKLVAMKPAVVASSRMPICPSATPKVDCIDGQADRYAVPRIAL